MKGNIKVYDLDTNVKPNVATDHLTLELLFSCLLGVRHLNPTSISEDIIIYITSCSNTPFWCCRSTL